MLKEPDLIKIFYAPRVWPDKCVFVARETYGIKHALPSHLVFHMIRYQLDRGLGYDYKHPIPQPDT